MRCSECEKQITADSDFCIYCGAKNIRKISDLKLTKKFIGITIIIIIAVITLTYILLEGNNVNKIKNNIQTQQLQKEITEEANKPKISDLKIHSDWDSERKGNYVYINGTVENIGSKKIKYAKIKAEFYDKNNKMIDTDYTIETDIDSVDLCSFEIMHQYDSDMDTITLEVEEVN